MGIVPEGGALEGGAPPELCESCGVGGIDVANSVLPVWLRLRLYHAVLFAVALATTGLRLFDMRFLTALVYAMLHDVFSFWVAADCGCC